MTNPDIVEVHRARLDKLANLYMDELQDRCSFTPTSLDEFLLKYGPEMGKVDYDRGQAILGLFPEYGGDCDPE